MFSRFSRVEPLRDFQRCKPVLAQPYLDMALHDGTPD